MAKEICWVEVKGRVGVDELREKIDDNKILLKYYGWDY